MEEIPEHVREFVRRVKAERQQQAEEFRHKLHTHDEEVRKEVEKWLGCSDI